MTKLTKDQKRKKKLAQRKNVSNIGSPKKPLPSLQPLTLKRIMINEEGDKIEEEYEGKVERAKFLYCEEILIDGRVSQSKPDKAVIITAWDYFGIAGCNFVHPGIEECDTLLTLITPNEVEGIVVAFPDWHGDEHFNTTGFLAFTECDPKFDIADKEAVANIEKNVNENIVPILANHSTVKSIETEFKLKSNTIFKAFDKYWSCTMFIAKRFEKQLEKKMDKKNMERDFVNRQSIDDVIAGTKSKNRDSSEDATDSV
jgi:hypothetical protein